MRLMRMRPWREFEDLQAVMSRCFGDSCWSPRLQHAEDESEAVWRPAVDFSETASELVYQLEMPGFEKDQIGLSVENGHLTVQAERKWEKTSEHDYHRTERRYGKFYRSFQLPTSANPETISATLKHGVLIVTVPKKEEATPKQIEVSVQ